MFGNGRKGLSKVQIVHPGVRGPPLRLPVVRLGQRRRVPETRATHGDVRGVRGLVFGMCFPMWGMEKMNPVYPRNSQNNSRQNRPTKSRQKTGWPALVLLVRPLRAPPSRKGRNKRRPPPRSANGPYAPRDVTRSPTRRNRRIWGFRFWCKVCAIGGTPIPDPCARSFVFTNQQPFEGWSTQPRNSVCASPPNK